jgi:glycosyltransferase involved in cell wall biosynthesis
VPRISIVTGGHLCRNPRVVKEAAALAAAGHDVVVFGPIHADDLAREDAPLAAAGGFRHVPVVDVSASGVGSPGWRARLERRVSAELVLRVGWQRPEALGYGVRATLRAAREHPSDIVIGHQEVGAWVAWRLAQEGRTVGIDFEDWYSRDLLPADRANLPVRLLDRIEGDLLRNAAHATTTSLALARALGDHHGARPPLAVYNAFPLAERESLSGTATDRQDRSRLSLHWVSQTLGAGRGLEAVCEALRRVTVPVDLHLRASTPSGARAWIEELFPAGGAHRLFVHPLVPPAELLARIAEHDVGLALERRDPPSRDLTVTNKILHYLVAGLAVIATDTAGQREVAAAASGAVNLVPPDDPAALAVAITRLASQPDELAAARASALRAAEDRFSWERQQAALLESVERALQGKPRTGRSAGASSPLAA